MKAKDKAEQLVNQMYENILQDGSLHTKMCSFMAAKLCAKVAVDAVIKSRPILPSFWTAKTLEDCTPQAKEYWQEVKAEFKMIKDGFLFRLQKTVSERS